MQMNLYRNTFHDDRCPYLYIEDSGDNTISELQRKLTYIENTFKDKDPIKLQLLKDSVTELYRLNDLWSEIRDQGLAILDEFEFPNEDDEEDLNLPEIDLESFIKTKLEKQ